MTIKEGINHFIALYDTFADHLRETEPIFGPERRKHLLELQQRLLRVAKWQREQREKSNTD